MNRGYSHTSEYLRLRRNIWDKVDYDPHPAQMEIHESDARFKVACCGRRFGKSTSAIRDSWPDYFIPNTEHWLVGPTYELGEREFSVLYDDVLRMPEIANHKGTKVSYSVQAGNMRVVFPWNTVVKVVSAEKPKSLQGKGLSSAIMCESGEHEELTWTRYIRPALADRRGRALFPSTPKGYNWYYHYWRRGQVPETYPQWASWQFPSWANTHIFDGPDDPEIEEMRATMSVMLFEQEVEAKFTSYEGRIYNEFDESTHVVDLQPIVDKHLMFWRNFWTIDFGFSNPFVCLDVMIDPQDNVYVWREYYVRHLPVVTHAKRLKERANPTGFHVNSIFADPADPDGIATLALYLGSAFGRRVGWSQGVEQLKVLMKVNEETHKPRLFIDPRCENLIRELNTLHLEENRKPGSNNNKEQQHKHDDHAADALRYFASEIFVLGAGAHLSDVYKYADLDGPKSGIFQYDQADIGRMGDTDYPFTLTDKWADIERSMQ